MHFGRVAVLATLGYFPACAIFVQVYRPQKPRQVSVCTSQTMADTQIDIALMLEGGIQVLVLWLGQQSTAIPGTPASHSRICNRLGRPRKPGQIWRPCLASNQVSSSYAKHHGSGFLKTMVCKLWCELESINLGNIECQLLSCQPGIDKLIPAHIATSRGKAHTLF